MKQILILIFICSISFSLYGQEDTRPISEIIKESLDFAVQQEMYLANSLKDSASLLPRSTDTGGDLVTCHSSWWTSGFFPGSLWYLYEYSGNEELKKMASLYTLRVEDQKNTTDNHDVGFMINCSFGNGYRLTHDDKYKNVMITAARSLSTRFRPKIGCIQSWNVAPWNQKKGWKCPVIIDNMMNLELLAEATKLSGDSAFYCIAVSHADVTMKNHFRPDYSCYHVVDYDPEMGNVHLRVTHQGYSDESAWARGQAWALYGYTMMYRETKEKKYLKQAKHIANYIITHLPADKIPYWDYNAPDIPNAYRDASAAAITCSALVELSQYVQKQDSEKYINVAEQQIRILSSSLYRADLGKNAGFILKHSVGNFPANSEIDVALSYADYYYIEAMMRYRKLKRE